MSGDSINPVVEVKDIRKIYKLYDKPIDRFRETMSIIHKDYHSNHFALDRINMTVNKGECVGIIGTNGSGKSTLLKIITGVLNPTEGEVKVRGRISALLELGTGFNMEYTGRENVFLNGTMLGLTRKEVEDKFQEIEDFAEIGDFIDQPVKTYSSGMFARLAFAVAINVDPDILIVDEALSVGDIFFQSKCYRKFNDFKEKGKTIIFVSHDMSSVLKYCERCLLINKGKQVALGPSSEVIDVYKKILVNQFDEEELPDTENAEEAEKTTETKGTEEKKQSNIIDTKWKESMLQNPNYIEYGDGKAAITDFAIFDENGNLANAIYKGTEFTIKIKVEFFEEVENPIVAYTIKDLKGTEITGTNTILEGKHIGKMKKGDIHVFSFKQKMPLQGAQYLLSFGCTSYVSDELVVYHRLYDIVNLQVISERNTVGFVDLDSTVEMD
ncbi:MAG: ABC transporter ATP-binding protein [Eubacterium sp.]|nr:ABC transporter ATP-binding protein [Eubacterium sp.]